ncbi:MAG: chromosome segregation protein SMC [Pseudomonadota bacterium]
MRLKSLEVVGFKSFVDRTVVHFEEGVTSIVGPNGCGKSNIVDAIRWVMGEQSAKHLRGGEMVDVIFNGSQKRPAMGMAQVFLTFDNSDGRAPADYAKYSEIQVGRRLYRSGESEYFINKTPCRLKDIVDLFLGTGVGSKAYSIIEQGMIGSIVSSKPEDRRMLIEEASGISKFKSRKEAALRKLEATKSNLLRLDDLIAELSRQLNSLNRQAKKAERYKVVSDELKERELALFSTKYLKERGELNSLDSECSKAREGSASASAELISLETNLESKRLELANMERELDEVQQSRWATQNNLKLTEADITHKLEKAESLDAHVTTAREELKLLEAKLADISVKLSDVNSEFVVADSMREDKRDLVAMLGDIVNGRRSKRDEVAYDSDELRKQIFEFATKFSESKSKLGHLGERSVEVTSQMAKDQTRIDQLDQEKKELEEKFQTKDESIQSVRDLKDSLLKERDELHPVIAQVEESYKLSKEKLDQVRASYQTKQSQIESLMELKRNLDGYKDGVKSVMKKISGEDGFKGVIGTISEFVSTSPQYETALGAVLGDKLQYVVVESQSKGIEAVEYLKSAASGRSTFVPMEINPVNLESTPPQGEGVIGPLNQHVSFTDEYKKLGNYIVGDVVLMKDLKSAIDVWREGTFGYTLATLDGEVIDPIGTITGGKGGNVAEQLLAQNRRLKELEDSNGCMKKELEDSEHALKEIEEDLFTRRNRLNEVSSEVHKQELVLISTESELKRIEDDLAHLEEERDQTTFELTDLFDEEKKIAEEQMSLKELCTELDSKQKEAESRLSEIQRQIEERDSSLHDEEDKFVEAKIALAQVEERSSAATRDVERLLSDKIEFLLNIHKSKNDVALEAQDAKVLRSQVDDLRLDLNFIVQDLQKLDTKEKELTDAYHQSKSLLREDEAKIHGLRKAHDEEVTKAHEVELKLTQRGSDLQHLVQTIGEKYRVDLPTHAVSYSKDDLNIEEEESLVSSLKDRLDKFGSVNVDAITEFNEIKERHDHIFAQHGDLTQSVSGLQKAIQKINKTSRERFKEAFDAVDGQFQKLFPALFKGGRARLLMTDEDNILESGIEIVAQPPGKKLQSVGLLSGGEKALTAIALVFSIFLIKPSPFCLLDEVDAPLDDVNVDRFNELIRSMTKHSQFILITHNKRTMELADLLYGVTMEEAGASKLVSVRLNKEGDTSVDLEGSAA